MKSGRTVTCRGCDHAAAYHADRERTVVSVLGPVSYRRAYYYCRRCGSLASQRSCGHGPEDRLTLSGTEVRRRLRAGLPLPAEFTRPEVAAVLRMSAFTISAKAIAGTEACLRFR